MKKRLAKKMKKRQTVEQNVQAVREPVKAEQFLNREPEAAPVPVPVPVDSLPDKETSTVKSGQKMNIFFQFSQHQVERQEIINRIKNQWKSQGHMLKDLKDLVIYLKVEDNKAYYVINESERGWVTAWE